jgi:hypothetical protein
MHSSNSEITETLPHSKTRILQLILCMYNRGKKCTAVIQRSLRPSHIARRAYILQLILCTCTILGRNAQAVKCPVIGWFSRAELNEIAWKESYICHTILSFLFIPTGLNVMEVQLLNRSMNQVRSMKNKQNVAWAPCGSMCLHQSCFVTLVESCPI